MQSEKYKNYFSAWCYLKRLLTETVKALDEKETEQKVSVRVANRRDAFKDVINIMAEIEDDDEV